MLVVRAGSEQKTSETETNTMAHYTVTSAKDGHQIEVFDGISKARAQRIADVLGIEVDYIQACDLADIESRAYRLES